MVENLSSGMVFRAEANNEHVYLQYDSYCTDSYVTTKYYHKIRHNSRVFLINI